jgi:hypothetical protein
MLHVAGRKSKVTTTHLWNVINTGLMKQGDLQNPTAAAAFLDLKDPLGH